MPESIEKMQLSFVDLNGFWDFHQIVRVRVVKDLKEESTINIFFGNHKIVINSVGQ